MSLNLFSTKNRYKGLLTTAKNSAPVPFNATPTGIIKNTILGIPKAEIDLGKKVVSKVADAVHTVQNKIVNRATEIVQNPKILVTEVQNSLPKNIIKERKDTSGKVSYA